MTRRSIRVGEIAEQIRGVSYGKEDASPVPRPGYLPILRAGNITEDGLRLDDLVFVPEMRVSARQRVRKNDLVIAASSGSLDVVGKAARALNDFEGGFGAFCKVLRPTSQIDPGYFYEFFRTPAYRRRISALAAGANINNLRSEHLDDLEMPLPSVSDQRRIATLLQKADALRAKRRATLTLLDSLTSAVFMEMFGDPRTNPKGFKAGGIEATVSNSKSDIRCGPFGTQLKVHELVPEGVPLLGIENVLDEGFQPVTTKFVSERKAHELRSFDVEPGDVLVTRMGTIGRACVVPSTFTGGRFSYHLFRIRPDRRKCLPAFLAATIARSGTFQSQLRASAHGAIMAGLNTNGLKAVRFLLPPLEKQEAFVRYVDALETQAVLQRQSLDRLDEIFRSVQHRAFDGQL